MYGANPNNKEPMKGFPQVGYLKNFISNENIIVGDYTYYDDPQGVERFEQNVLYHFPFIGDKLIIGKFCAIAKDVKFIMNGANHSMDGFSTYPFYIFGNGWEKVMPQEGELPLYRSNKRYYNYVVGHTSMIFAEELLIASPIGSATPPKCSAKKFSANAKYDMTFAWWLHPWPSLGYKA